VPAQSNDLLRRGVIAAERGRVREGLALIREAIALDGQNAEAHAQLGRWLSRLHRGAEAVAVAERALGLDPTDAVTLDTIGVVLSRAGQHERAVECFERAVGADTRRASLHFNLGSSLRFLGRFEDAARAYETCLEIDPRYWRAHTALAQLTTQTPARNHLDRLLHHLAQPGLDVNAELQLRHAAAKELEDLGRYADAFEQLLIGKHRKRADRGYSFDRDRALFETVMRLFASPLPEPAARHANVSPIFVVGMPRTGTTLVERILSSHSQVSSAGESQNLGVLIKRATATPSRHVLDEATLERSMALDLGAIGDAYIAQTRPDDRPRFVDKMPLNFFYLGHIARALPAARLVVVRRQPLDACLSNFRQLFALDFSYYDYAYDLEDTARYYAMFDRLVAHWERVLPGRMHEIQYERLVVDSRAETQRLLEHCGLEWEQRCLEFERNPAPVATASAVQVRQPLHAGAIGRWRHYETGLRPVIETLRGMGVDPTPEVAVGRQS